MTIEVLIAGIDLAWTTYRKSGLCFLSVRGDDVALSLLEATVVSGAELIERLTAPGGTVIAAIDAPLIRRAGCTAERDLARTFGRFHAAAYNANLDFLERKGLMAGPRLGDALLAEGFDLDAHHAGPAAVGRFAFEMYPHAFHVAAFELERRIAYKKGRIASRRVGFGQYQALLATLLEREAPALLDEPAVAAILDPAAVAIGGARLKEVEDMLDALTCAVAALIAWRHGIRKGDVFGDAVNGYIAVPGLHRIPRFMDATPVG
jgi:predicted RNase H-like nuclease